MMKLGLFILSLFTPLTLLAWGVSSSPLSSSAKEAVLEYHRGILSLYRSSSAWLEQSEKQVPKLKASEKARRCRIENSAVSCQAALIELKAYSRVPAPPAVLFELEYDLKNKYELDVETGLRVFQLSTALRWIYRRDLYNGVPMPTVANRRSFDKFRADLISFYKTKNLELRKAAPMIPARLVL